MSEYTSKGQGALNTVLGAIGTAGATGILNGGIGGIFGNGCGNGYGWNGGCHENMPVNRYEATQSARIAELETEVKLRDANIYTDSKLLDLYKYFDGEVKDIRNALCAQAIVNQRTDDAIKMEAERRCCSDNAIVNYVNATFYPKMIADVTVGTTNVAQLLYNPIPDCGCCSK